jgi:diguanylate cyclase (GGDEF)-like protein
MGFRLNRRVLAVYAVILSLGIALVASIYAKGSMVLSSSMHLLDAKLPLVEQVLALKTTVSERVLMLHDFTASRARDEYLGGFMRGDDRFAETLALIARNPDYRHYAAPVAQRYEELKETARELDQALQGSAPDRDATAALLNQISYLGLLTQAELDVLANVVLSEVYNGGRVTESGVNSITRVVLAFCLILLAIAGFVGYYINAFVSDVEARRRLAMFAEKNPNPVLRLESDGSIGWLNPATEHMLAAARKLAPRDLLPPDLTGQLQRMRAGESSCEHSEYEVSRLTLGCSIHYLKEFDTYHAYVADITPRRQAERTLAHQAYHDALTGLPNRYRFGEQLRAMLGSAGEAQRPAVLLINLNRFRTVIASFGHLAGDRLLDLVATRLRHALEDCRESCSNSTLFRLEGDQFAVLIAEAACGDAARCLARNMEISFSAPFVVENHELFVGIAIGYAAFPRDGRDMVTLVRNADAALQKIKRDRGTGILAYSEEINIRAIEQLALETDLRYALERKELELVYQPQVDIANRAVIGSEVLLRWKSSTRGFVPPSEFIPIAEEIGLIVPIGEWILRTACTQLKSWGERGLPALTVAVNISARQFIQPDFTERVARIIHEAGIDPRWIELEITESVAIQNVETTCATLARLKTLGVRLAIDDFGTGYSSLSYLKRFPVDKLKVDQSFVRNFTRDENDAAITRAIIQLGHSLNLRVIAEGVETAEHLVRLHEYGCDEIQGYLFSKPLPAEELEKLLWAWKALPQEKRELRAAA